MIKKKIGNLSTYLSEIAVHGIQEKKGHDIVRLDLRELNSSVSDYFIICNADSATQVKAIADSVEEEIYKTRKLIHGEKKVWIMPTGLFLIILTL